HRDVTHATARCANAQIPHLGRPHGCYDRTRRDTHRPGRPRAENDLTATIVARRAVGVQLRGRIEHYGMTAKESNLAALPGSRSADRPRDPYGAGVAREAHVVSVEHRPRAEGQISVVDPKTYLIGEAAASQRSSQGAEIGGQLSRCHHQASARGASR